MAPNEPDSLDDREHELEDLVREAPLRGGNTFLGLVYQCDESVEAGCRTIL